MSLYMRCVKTELILHVNFELCAPNRPQYYGKMLALKFL